MRTAAIRLSHKKKSQQPALQKICGWNMHDEEELLVSQDFR